MQVLFEQSTKGIGVYNDDAIGYCGNCFWAIDGATDLFGCNPITQQDDVQWVVQRLSLLLTKLCDEVRPLENILTEATGRLLSEIRGTGIALDDIAPYMLPTYSIAFGRLSKHELQYLLLGDCAIRLHDHRRETVLEDKMIAPFAKMDKEKIRKLQSDGILSEETERAVYQRTRKLANADNGYWIGSVDGKAIPHALIGSVKTTKFARVLCYTDGFGAYYDIFGQKPENEFEEDGVKQMSQRLDRYYEKEGGASLLKKKDDASALLLSALEGTW